MGNLRTNFPNQEGMGNLKTDLSDQKGVENQKNNFLNLKNMGKGKRAVFFSIVSVMIVVLFVALSGLITNFKLDETKLEATRTRVTVLNSLVQDMEDTYFEKIVYVASKNSLIGLSRYYSQDYNRINKQLDSALENVIQKGILIDNAGIHNLTKLGYINYDYTVSGLVDEFKLLFDDMGMDIVKLTINITPESLEQIDAWTFRLEADINYDFKDKDKIASWKGVTTRIVDISVIGLYMFDVESVRTNFGNVSNNWSIDTSPYTEPSIYNKLSKRYPVVGLQDHGKGICSPDFRRSGEGCDTDV